MEVKDTIVIELCSTCINCKQTFDSDEKLIGHDCKTKIENLLSSCEGHAAEDASYQSNNPLSTYGDHRTKDPGNLLRNALSKFGDQASKDSGYQVNSSLQTCDDTKNESMDLQPSGGSSDGQETQIRVVTDDFLKETPPIQPYSCKMCHQRFHLLLDYVTHENNDCFKSSTSAYRCDICNKEFREKRFLNIHKTRIHEKPKTTKPMQTEGLYCDKCRKRCSSLEEYDKHLQAKDTLVCVMCRFACHSTIELRAHKATHKYQYNCQQCHDFRSNDFDLFQRHLSTHSVHEVTVNEIKVEQNMGDDDENPLQLPEEALYLSDASALIKTELPIEGYSPSHDEEADLQRCSVVLEKSTGSRAEDKVLHDQIIKEEPAPARTLRRARRTRVKVEMDSDEEDRMCKRNIRKSRDSLLREVKRLKKKNKLLKYHRCNVCEFGCWGWSLFSEHTATHFKYKHLRCAHCSYACNFKPALICHLYKHMNWTLLKCSMCKNQYTTEKGLRYHMQRHDAKRFPCRKCSMAFFTHRELIRHHERRHTSHERILCDRCPLSFITAGQLQRHVMSHHSLPGQRHKCSDCSYSTMFSSQLKKHYTRLHADVKKSFSCHECGQSYKLKCDLSSHMLSHRPEYEPYRCKKDSCSFRAKKKKELTEHMRQVHHMSNLEMQGHACPHCKKRFNRYQLMKHLLEAHSDVVTKFECNECGEVFPRKSFVSQHILAKHPKTVNFRYPCLVCEEEFNTSARLTFHKRKHLEPESLPCTLCPKIFKSSYSLTDHLKTHQNKNNNKYCCQVCSFKTNKVYLLTMHDRIHKNETIFQCPKCPFNFNTLKNLKTHNRVIHEGKKLKCDECEYSCAKGSYMTVHKKRWHSNEGLTHECSICGTKCVTEALLNRHKYTTHKHLLAFRCKDCDFKSRGAKELKVHVNLNHAFDLQHVCKECNMRFKSKKLLLMHTNIMHVNVQQYKCQLCMFACSSSNGLDIHNKRIHTESNKQYLLVEATFVEGNISQEVPEGQALNVAVFSCEQCTFVCNSLTEFNDHKAVHSLPFCSECKCTLPSLLHYQLHISQLHGVGLFNNNLYYCNRCAFSCKTLQHMETHKNDHKTETSVINDFDDLITSDFIRQEQTEDNKCDDSSDDGVVLSDYHKVRSVRKADSDVCEEPEAANAEYEIPIEEFQMEFDNDCTDEVTYDSNIKEETSEFIDLEESIEKYCEKNFMLGKLISEEPAGVLHPRMSQKTAPPAETSLSPSDGEEEGSRVFKCPECNKTFLKRNKLEKHILLKHSSSEWFTCRSKLCGYFTNNVEEYLKHTKTHKLTGRYKCDQCHYVGDKKASLKKHKATHSKPFLCEVCSYNCSSRDGLNKHMNIHRPQGRFQCDYCERVFSQRLALVKHIQNKHLPKKLHPCHLCEYTAKSAFYLNHHRELCHSKQNNFKCHICPDHFPAKRFLLEHIRMKHKKVSPTRFPCQRCHRSYANIARLEEHMQKSHTSLAEPEPSYVCETCDKPFRSPILLKNHQVRHTSNYFYCAHCSYKSLFKSRLADHLQRMHTLSFPCSKCSKKFGSNKKLQLHFKLHDHKRNRFFECSACDTSFSNAQVLRRHKAFCQQKKKQECKLCNFKTHRPFDLKVHYERQHRQEKNFVCDICENPYTSRTLLNLHKLRSHKNLNPFSCSQCDFQCKTWSDLKRHENVSHTSDADRPFQCPHCSYKFIQKRLLQSHMTALHKDLQKYACKHCNFACNSLNGINLHSKRLHNA